MGLFNGTTVSDKTTLSGVLMLGLFLELVVLPPSGQTLKLSITAIVQQSGKYIYPLFDKS